MDGERNKQKISLLYRSSVGEYFLSLPQHDYIQGWHYPRVLESILSMVHKKKKKIEI